MILLCSLIFSYCGVSSCSQICKRHDDTTKCCLGYIWNETLGECLACNDGFIGENCTATCPELYYGQECRLKCNCTKDQCNHVAGCSNSVSEACDKGYIGHNCSDPCPPPYYGLECASLCNCTDNQYCNHVHGCIQPQGDACQKTKLKPEKHQSVTSLMCAAVVCLLIISVICFTSYVYIRFRMKQCVDFPRAL